MPRGLKTRKAGKNGAGKCRLGRGHSPGKHSTRSSAALILPECRTGSAAGMQPEESGCGADGIQREATLRDAAPAPEVPPGAGSKKSSPSEIKEFSHKVFPPVPRGFARTKPWNIPRAEPGWGISPGTIPGCQDHSRDLGSLPSCGRRGLHPSEWNFGTPFPTFPIP